MDDEFVRDNDARSPDVFAKPWEAEILTGDASYEPGRTVEPWEEGENTRGLRERYMEYDEEEKAALPEEAEDLKERGEEPHMPAS